MRRVRARTLLFLFGCVLEGMSSQKERRLKLQQAPTFGVLESGETSDTINGVDLDEV